MKIGIFGGTFNPIHNGHLSLANQLIDNGTVDRILFVVSAHPPHKNEPQISASQRYEMVCLALEGHSALVPCDMELKRAGSSYTVDTYAALREQYPKDELFFMMGADMFIDIPYWKSPEVLFKNIHFLVADRDLAFRDEIYQQQVAKIEEKFNPKVTFIPIKTPQISSTDLRDSIEKCRKFLPEKVYNYIKRNGLYAG